jgi:ribokinase
MDIINVGSLNLDWVYQVPHFVHPGETIAALAYHEYLGGKGLNQSIALARAGAEVAHVGAVGSNGAALREALIREGINTDFVKSLDGPSGHAIIQVSPEGENAIVLFPGTNQQLSLEQITQAIQAFPEAKAVLLQNETNHLAEIMQLAKQAGKLLAYNPAPVLPNLVQLPLHLVDVLILNEIEAESLPLSEAHFGQIVRSTERIFPYGAEIVIVKTLGANGVSITTQGKTQHFPAIPVKQVIDTTAAGDTFIGYFLAEYLQDANISRSAQLATQAASLCIQKRGAMQSIPKRVMMP